jgi:hypothetical protein
VKHFRHSPFASGKISSALPVQPVERVRPTRVANRFNRSLWGANKARQSPIFASQP